MATPTKSDIVKLRAKVRECKMWAGEFIAKAADAAAEDDIHSYEGAMAEATRLTLLAAKYIKAVDAAVSEREAV